MSYENNSYLWVLGMPINCQYCTLLWL